MSTYQPDKWVIISITTPSEEVFHKVFASWYGGYLSGDSWKLNSGNTSAHKIGPIYNVEGYSGSIYELHEDSYGLSAYTFGVLHSLLENAGDIMKILSEEESLRYLEEVCNE